MDDLISRQAVAILDSFTKLYCRDKTVKDDLVFRCGECNFQMSDGRCMVKVFKCEKCPDYKEFGAMGDL